MRGYKYIGPVENTRRLNLLIDFRNQAISYFNSRRAAFNSLRPQDTEDSQTYRRHINTHISEIDEIIMAADVFPSVQWSPPPIIGGRARNLNLIANIFNLDAYRISPEVLLDFLDRAIGKYEKNAKGSIFRLFNPFFYASLVVYAFSIAPFWFFREIGFKTHTVESSFFGRTIKFLFALIPLLASFLGILKHLDLLVPFKTYVQNLLIAYS